MYGFGWGNNIEPWLDYFQNTSDQHRLTFFCREFRFDKKSYPDIEIVELKTLNPFKANIRRRVAGRDFDLLYIQGLYDYPIIFLLLIFTKAKIKAINIWNNTNFMKGTLRNKKFWQIPFYRFILHRAHRIIFTWYGTHHDFKKHYSFPEKKLLIQPWGIREKIFQERPVPKHNFTQTYLSALSSDDIFLFWPENISPDEHIDKLLLALSKIPTSFKVKVLVFSGHQKEEDDYFRYLKKIIDEKNLSSVEIRIGIYLPYQDIMALWERADLTIKLSSKDQLSNGIIEALYFRTPMILNDWYPYQKLKEKEFRVDLVGLDEESIRIALEKNLSNIQKNRLFYKELGDHNREIVKKYFNFDKNVEELISYLERLKK